MHFDLSDQYRYRPSLVHKLDPRVKVVATFSYILVVNLTPVGKWESFYFFLALILIAAWLTRLGLFFAARRSFLVLPFVLVSIAVCFTTPGPTLFTVPGIGWSVSEPGLVRFFTILARSWLAMQAAILLTVTTRFFNLLWAMGALRFPNLLIATIGFMYRYLFVVVDEARRMMQARAARSVEVPGGANPSIRWRGRVTGMMVGSLFLRALDRSERVYAAMLSRGYDGNIQTLTHFKMTTMDWGALALMGLMLTMPLIFTLIG